MTYRTVRFPSVGSTNDIVLDAAAAGTEPGLVVVADEQVTGKGRRARDWASPVGGLWCSVLLRPDVALAMRGLVPIAVGIAAVRAVRRLGVEGRLRWPNDVMVGDRKLGGILVESRTKDGAFERLVAGIGINVVNDAPTRHAVALNELVDNAEPRALLTTLLDELGPVEDALRAGDVKLVCQQFMQLAWGTDREVLVDGEAVVVREIAIDGALIVERPDGKVDIVRSGSLRLP